MKMPPEESTPRRRYDASRRQAEARDRQRRVVEAAGRLFLDQGYGATSIDQIAKAAGVSSQSVYASFESKAGILYRAVQLARTGDEEGSLRESEEARAIVHTRDQRERCRLTAQLLRRAYDRSARLIAVVEQAAATDPALAALHAEFRELRRASVMAISGEVPAKALRKGLTLERAIDTMTFLGAAHTYTELVDGLGWTPDEYEAWLADALYQLVFAR